MKVLVLDCDPGELGTTVSALRAFGLDCVGTSICEEARSILRNRVDGMILELRFRNAPRGGLVVLEYARSELHCAGAAILYTKEMDQLARAECVRLGALYVLKPTVPIVGLVAYLWEHQRLTNARFPSGLRERVRPRDEATTGTHARTSLDESDDHIQAGAEAWKHEYGLTAKQTEVLAAAARGETRCGGEKLIDAHAATLE